MATYNLNVSASSTFAADGTASVTFSPPSLEYWDITSKTVRTSDPLTTTTVPVASIFLDGIEQEGTYTGNFDTSDTPHHVEKGQQLTCKWTGGTAGKTATFNLSGTRSTY